MLNEIIKNVAYILEDKAALDNLYDISNDDAVDVCDSVLTYITLCNFVISNIAQWHLCYKCTEEIVSDSAGKLSLSDLSYAPCVIKSVKDQNFKQVKFNVSMDYIYVNNPNRMHFIEYAFIPKDLTSLDDTVLLPMGLDYKCICYGIVSEFYALKMQFTEANIWEIKFKDCLRNLSKNYRSLKFAGRGWL